MWRYAWTDEATAVITGTGAGPTADVVAAITLPWHECEILGHTMRLTALAGTPNWSLHAAAAQADTAKRYCVKVAAAAAETDELALYDPPKPFVSQESPRTKVAYATFENDGGGGDASTWAIRLLVRWWQQPGSA